jgi:death-on-curing family protein
LPNEPIWLETAEVIELNRLIVAETGEPFLVRDLGGLESAVERPRNCSRYEAQDDALTLAVTLLFGIAGNHPFLQGNKRTGFEAALIFLLNKRLHARCVPGRRRPRRPDHRRHRPHDDRARVRRSAAAVCEAVAWGWVSVRQSQ